MHDPFRTNYYETYLAALSQSRKSGSNVLVYQAWSLIDNFEWCMAYYQKFGMVYVDFNDN